MNLYFCLYCADFIICLDIALDLYWLWSSGKCSALNACVSRVQKRVTSYDKLSTKAIVVSQFPPRNEKRGKKISASYLSVLILFLTIPSFYLYLVLSKHLTFFSLHSEFTSLLENT